MSGYLMTLSTRLTIVMCLGSSITGAAYTVYTNFKPMELLTWFFLTFLPRKLRELFEFVVQIVIDALLSIFDMIRNLFIKAWNAVKEVFEKIKEELSKIANKIKEEVEKLIEKVIQAFTKIFEKIERAFTGVIPKIEKGVKDLPGKIANAGKKVVDDVGKAPEKIVKDIDKKGKKSIDEISGGFNKLSNYAKKKIEKAPEEGAKEARKQFSKWLKFR